MAKKKQQLSQLIATRKFFDTKQNKEINVNVEIFCTKERAKELVDAKVAEIVCLKN